MLFFATHALPCLGEASERARVCGERCYIQTISDMLTSAAIRTGCFFSKLNPAPPAFYSIILIIMLWPTRTCKKSLTGPVTSLFQVNHLQKETYDKAQAHPTKPCHALPAMPCPGLAKQPERASARVCGERCYIQPLSNMC